jgi:formylglycine-generating enzyme required for sulfatase activity
MTHCVPSLYNPLDPKFSEYLTPGREWLHPVEQVSWDDCAQALGRFGLLLPTEAQWERAARGGTSTVYSTGDERETLEGAANIADQSAYLLGAQWEGIEEWPEYDDGFRVHAPVDALAPNPFGLCHVHGNVAEWCRDWFVQYTDDAGAPAPGDGYRVAATPKKQENVKILRGGSCRSGVKEARSSSRQYRATRFADFYVGVRPARALSR